MSNREVIYEALKEIHKEYASNLYDFMQNELQAQVQLYNKLRELIKGKITIELEKDKPIPNQPMQGSVVRLENWSRENKHDICIVKEGSYSKSNDFEIETIIEIKMGYNFNSAQFNGEGIKKDYEILKKKYSEAESPEAFLVYFLGNSFNEQEKQQNKGESHIEIYKRLLKEGVGEENILKNHVFIVFTDCIKNGVMKDID